jgi:hypothetical protein
MVVALLGPLADGTPDWPPPWPLRRDERENLGLIAEALNLDRESYAQLCRIAKGLLADTSFVELAELLECVLLRVPIISGELVYALHAALTKEQSNATQDASGNHHSG